MGKPGGKNSRVVLFEEINFEAFSDEGKSGSFMTNAENVFSWISCIDNVYNDDNNLSDIVWSFSNKQFKLMAQITEKQLKNGTLKNSNLNISFYMSTYRIVLQGNDCRQWYVNYFDKLKSEVYKRKDSSDKDILPEQIDCLIRPSKTENITSPNIIPHVEVEDETQDTVGIFTEKTPTKKIDKPDVTPAITPTRRRSLPATPVITNKDSQIITSLKLAVEKLIEENVKLTTELHKLTLQTQDLSKECSTFKSQTTELKEEISILKIRVENTKNNDTEVKLHDMEEFTKKQFTDLNQEISVIKTKIANFDSNKVKLCDLEEKVANAVTQEQFCEIDSLRKHVKKLGDQLKDLEEATNIIQNDLFDGEIVSKENKHHKHQQQTNGVNSHSDENTTVSDSTQMKERRIPPIFRDVTNQRNPIFMFGDSNTKGLNSNKLKIDISSLSGATLDSAIAYLKQSATINDTVKGVIYHLGTNNLTSDTAEEMKLKINEVDKLTRQKFPNAKVAFTQLPSRDDVSESKIKQINEFIKQHKNMYLIQIKTLPKHFTRDRIHFNQHGLAIVAINIKRWTSGIIGQRPSTTQINPQYQQDGNNQLYTPRFPSYRNGFLWPPAWFGSHLYNTSAANNTFFK